MVKWIPAMGKITINIYEYSTKISMVPLAILVGICRAWKKEVFSGPIPVLWAGILTSIGAIAPGLAGAET